MLSLTLCFLLAVVHKLDSRSHCPTAEASWNAYASQPARDTTETICTFIIAHYRKHQQSSSDNVLAHLVVLMLMHDTELNPGPKSESRFPCGTCQNPVNWEQKGVCCDTCNQWYHADCQNIKSIIYDKTGDSNTSWHCLTCGMPNFSPSVLNFTHTRSLSDEGDITLGSISPGAPLAMSSPIPPKRKDNRHHKPTLKLLNVNCRSIWDKKGQFQHLIDSTVPDIVVATETWLKPEQGDGEIGEPGRFSADYTGETDQVKVKEVGYLSL